MKKRLVKIIVTALLLNVAFIGNVYAAQWTTLHDNKHAKIMLDKQSIVESGKYQKAWVNIDYKTLQTNIEYPEKSYNNAKLLWYFNCAEQKSATAQVYQSFNEEQVYSAAIDVKRARFLEPVPETEADIAMHYVCQQKEREAALKEKKAQAAENAKTQAAKPKESVEAPVVAPAVSAPPVAPLPESSPAPVVEAEKPIAIEKKPETEEKSKTEKKPKNSSKKLVKKSDKEPKSKEKNESEKEEKNDEAIVEAESSEESDQAPNVDDKDKNGDKERLANKKRRVAPWKYTGSRGPEFWGDLSPDYASCKTGMNQSPINIDKTITSTPKPLKTFQRFPAVEIVNNGQTIQADFKPGNVLVVDGRMYQMKHVTFHAPSENQIMGKSFPLEAQFLHADADGNLAILAVMYEEGNDSKAIAKLWSQMPKRKGKPTKLSSSVLAGELMPRQKEYYRFSGSLTTPPCSEGVVWVVMKAPMTVSKRQVAAFKDVIREDNNRPIQPLNSRMVIE